MAKPTKSLAKGSSSKNGARMNSAQRGTSTEKVNDIPPPPGPDASWEEQSEYLERYSLEQREAAGYAKVVHEPKFFEELRQSAIAQRKRKKKTSDK